jgi:hypothetical protein
MPAIPAFERLRQEDREFKASPGYIETISKTKQSKQTKTTHTQ